MESLGRDRTMPSTAITYSSLKSLIIELLITYQKKKRVDNRITNKMTNASQKTLKELRTTRMHGGHHYVADLNFFYLILLTYQKNKDFIVL